jgi:hypothetical protein
VAITTPIKSFSELRLRLKDSVQIQRIGSHYKARFKGAANCVIGSTAQEARERLMNTRQSYLRDTPLNLKRREHNWATGFREGK